MKTRYLFLLFAFCFNPAWADFSNTQMWYHPRFIEDNAPYILDFRGEWPTDCHPGEQKPVIKNYTGDSVLIEFETIVEHPLCNDTPTPYRVLVDMSDVIDDVVGVFYGVNVTIRFAGAERVYRFDKNCTLCGDPVPPPRDVKPEAGLYFSSGLEKQGLLLARQNQRMGAYPLIYDESGSSEWVLGPGGIVEDVFFAELFESTGGQCLGCMPPDEPPQMGVVGKISMLMDSEGVIQVKINDGLFRTYEPSQFGYGEFTVMGLDDSGAYIIPDLSGRWAFSDDESLFPSTPPPTAILPLVFDIKLKTYNPGDPPPPVITPPPTQYAFYSVLDIEGEPVAELLCGYRDEMVCDLKSPTLGEFEDGYEVRMLSIERMIMTNTAPNEPHDGIVDGTGIVVRID